MPTTTVLGNAFHSVSQNGVHLFEQGPFTIWIGNLVLDLASAPLPPGRYRVKAEVVLAGKVEIYLPRDAAYTLTGSTVIGERKVREGLDVGKELRRRWDHFFGRSSQVPALPASFPPAPRDGSLSFELEIETLVGEVKVYRI